MKRPSDKLLKDLSNEELSAESAWHLNQAAMLREQVERLRESALDLDEQAADEVLHAATEIEAEAEAHTHQSNLLEALHAARLSDRGVGEVVHSAKA